MSKKVFTIIVVLLIALFASIVLNVAMIKKTKEYSKNYSEEDRLENKVASMNNSYMGAFESYTGELASNLSLFSPAYQNSDPKMELYTISKIENMVDTFGTFGTTPLFFVEKEKIPNEKELTNFPEVAVMRVYVKLAMSISNNKQNIQNIASRIRDGKSLTDSEVTYLNDFKSLIEQARMVMVEPAYTTLQYSKIEDLLLKDDKNTLNKQLKNLEDISQKLDSLVYKKWKRSNNFLAIG